jgi:superfamily II DNA or RNA helicase
MKLRSHQRQLKQILENISHEQMPFKILADIVPGGGKSMFAGILAQRFPNHKIAWYVPRLSLQHQGALSTLREFGIDLRETDGNEILPSRDARGFIATQQALAVDKGNSHAYEIDRIPYIVIVDEVHHAKVSHNGEMNELAQRLNNLRPDGLVLMTGTLETSDNKFIWGVPYRENGNRYEVDLDAFKEQGGHVISYTRSDALRESAIVPLHFHQFDGEVEWEKPKAHGAEKPLVRKRLSMLNREEASNGVFTALRTSFAKELFQNGVDHWVKHSNGGQLLVVVPPRRAHNSKAEYGPYVEMLRAQGIPTGLAVQDNAEAQSDIRQFRSGHFRALVTVAMAYEGLDVPAITHLVCLTNIRSAPWIEQMLARSWRRNDAAGKKIAHAFIPQDPLMMTVVQKIKDEITASILIPTEGPPPPPPPPGETQFIIPIDGTVDSIIQAALDGRIEYGEAETQILAVFEAHGLPRSHPGVSEIMDRITALLSKTQEPKVTSNLTVAELEQSYRTEIANRCATLNNARMKNLGIGNPSKFDLKYHQTLVVKHFQMRVPEMGLKNLRKVTEYLANL